MMSDKKRRSERQYKLGMAVMTSGLYGRKLSFKNALWMLCCFADQNGRGWVYNEAISRVSHVGKEQARRIKRQLEADGFVKFKHVRGRGQHTHFWLDIDAIQATIEKTPGVGEKQGYQAPSIGLKAGPNVDLVPTTPGDYSPPTGGVYGEDIAHLQVGHNHPQVGGTPLCDTLDPTSRGGVKGNKNIITGARGAQSGFLSPSGDGPPRDAAGNLIRDDADNLSREANRILGIHWCRTYLVDKFFILDGSHVVARVEGPTNRAIVAEGVKSLSKGPEIVVMDILDDVRAS